MANWITEQEVKDFMDLKGNEKDDLINKIISRIQDIIEKYCDRIFSQSQVTEYYDGGKTRIFVKRPPIDSGVTVEIWDDPDRAFPTSTKLDSTDFAVDYEGGIIYLEYPASDGFQSIKVKYTGGYTSTTFPLALKQALIELVTLRIKQGVQGELGVSSRSTPSGSIVFMEDVPKSVRDVLDFFRL